MSSRRPTVTIVEQPASKIQRFRYASEVDGTRSVGSIPGVNSRPERRTYPTIKVTGYTGPMVVMLSLVNPHDNRAHPHAITGNDPRYECRLGVIYVVTDEPEVVFNNIGVLCVKSKNKNHVSTALEKRRLANLDPLKGGFDHIADHSLIDFAAVRLCFKVFLPGPDFSTKDRNDHSKYTVELKPVVSEIVYDAKKLSDLKIVYLTKVAGSISGGTEMILLCEKYTGTNPEVVFTDYAGWEKKAHVKLHHKQAAIVFDTPPYRDTKCALHVQVAVFLQRPGPKGSTGQEPPERSLPVWVEYIPQQPQAPPSGIKRPPSNYMESKRMKVPLAEEYDIMEYLNRLPISTPAHGEKLFAEIPPPLYNEEFMDTAGPSHSMKTAMERNSKPTNFEQPSPALANFLTQQAYLQNMQRINNTSPKMSVNRTTSSETPLYESPNALLNLNPANQNDTFDLDLFGMNPVMPDPNESPSMTNANRFALNDNQVFNPSQSPQKANNEDVDPYLSKKLNKDILLSQHAMWNDIQKNLLSIQTEGNAVPMSPESVGNVYENNVDMNPFSPLPNVVPTAPLIQDRDPDIVNDHNASFSLQMTFNDSPEAVTSALFNKITAVNEDFDELEFDANELDQKLVPSKEALLRRMYQADVPLSSHEKFHNARPLGSHGWNCQFVREHQRISHQTVIGQQANMAANPFLSGNHSHSFSGTLEHQIRIPHPTTQLGQEANATQTTFVGFDCCPNISSKLLPTSFENYMINEEDEAEKVSGELDQLHLD